MHARLRPALVTALAFLPLHLAGAADFKGTPAKMARQHEIAVEESYSFLRTAADVNRLVASGGLVPVTANADFTLSGVSFPFARPEVRSFIEHFAAQYHESTGEQLVVTSLTRPEAAQPRNAHVLSVHPAGMAVDLRVPAATSRHAWFDRALEAMQRDGMIDVTREHTPPHYHIAVFAEQWMPFAARQDSLAALGRTQSSIAEAAKAPVAAAPEPREPAEPGRGSLAGFFLSMAVLLGVTAPALRVGRGKRKMA
jgi:hypothetical protein